MGSGISKAPDAYRNDRVIPLPNKPSKSLDSAPKNTSVFEISLNEDLTQMVISAAHQGERYHRRHTDTRLEKLKLRKVPLHLRIVDESNQRFDKRASIGGRKASEAGRKCSSDGVTHLERIKWRKLPKSMREGLPEIAEES